MARTESPPTRAYWQLVDLARLDGASDAQFFALTWLAAGRMVAARQVRGISTVDQLTELQAWKELHEAGFPLEAYDLIAAQRSSAVAHDVGRRAAAAAIVSELEAELGQHRWDVLPCITESSGRRGEAEGTVVSELASLLMDMVGAPPDSEVWIPFDLKGQLTVEALRRGWRVHAASPLASWPLVRQLLLTIETGLPQPPAVRTEVERDPAGRPVGRAEYALVMPPFGLHVKDSRMSMWDITETRAHEQFARSESWALFEFANRINKRAVFVTPQGVLFAKGQEQRLREYLLNRGNKSTKVQAVITLPPGVFGATAIAGAITLMDIAGEPNAIYMADLGSGRRSLQEAGDIVSAGREVALGRAQTDKARLVTHDEIEANEFSFAPSRYLRRVVDLGEHAVKLGDICEAVRPPAASKEATPFEVAEVGLPDLHQWHPINHDIEKTVYLKSAPKDATLVQSGDIVMSIKGSVGRVALMGAAAQHRPTVVSQSCLVLRLDPKWHEKNLSPEVLVMYLRSPHGQAQLDGLQVGASVQHISPGTLMSAVMVPLPSAQTYVEIRQDYDQLCHLEHQVASLGGEMADISQRRWPEMLQ
ncbi:N-6 DNA methylase [Cupriavidus basilensis]|uniref:N-6 DNA methylase n=1 Tax=Cupriavidus basilensis TaxID=68895 RepID=UPI0023E8D01A|nr:N-6 DNA methylase [Cupriavidus basilensis]MDF3887907.1 N-6 DNA methylase [Cupriavidus basilensis]